MENRTVFKVFLSAPSDVSDDVVIAKEYINSTLKSHRGGFEFEASDFNDIPSKISDCSPQEIINSHIQNLNIDIYIGLMCEKFGTPTENFGSGTQEEFETCLNKFRDSGDLHISFLFKDSKKMLQDADHDTVKSWFDVKEFRDNRIGKIGIYRDYATEDDLKERVKSIIDDFMEKKVDGNSYPISEAGLTQNTKNDNHPKLFDIIRNEWLDSTGQELTNGIKSKISLNDIYVPLNLVNESAMQIPKGEIDQIEKPIGFSDDLEQLSPFSVYVGGEGSGKTTILKKLFSSAIHLGKVPVFLDCEDNVASKFHDIPSLINKKFKEQYDAKGIENYSDLPKDKKIVLMDNFDAIGINNKGKIELTKNLRLQCRCVFITVDSEFYSSQFDFALLTQTDLNDFEIFEIQEFNRNQIQQITTKWIKAGQEFDLPEQEAENQIETYVLLLNDIFGFNYVPKFPLVILISLLGISGGEAASELRHPSFARYYEYLLAKHLFSTFPDNKIDLAHSLFGYLAHKFYLKDSERIKRAFIDKLLQQFSTNGDLPLEDIKSTFNLAVLSGIISESSEEYKFKHNYAFYYFLTKHWSSNLSDTEIDKLVEELSENLHLKRSASILIFLAYQNRHECIIKLLQRQLGETLCDEVEFDFESKKSSKFTKLIEISPRLLISSGEKQKQAMIEGEEDKEKELNQLEPEKDEHKRPPNDFTMNFIVAIRRIEVSGQLLKCHAHAVNMDADTKYQLFENSVNLGLRLLNRLLTNVFEDPDPFVSFLHFHLKDKMNKDEVKHIVFMFVSNILASHMILWSKYLGARMLEKTASRVAQNNKKSIAHQLVKMAINLDTKEHLGEINLDDAFKVCHNNKVAMTVLRMLAWRRLVMRPKDDRSQRQRVLSKLDIGVKSQKKLLNKQGSTHSKNRWQ